MRKIIVVPLLLISGTALGQLEKPKVMPATLPVVKSIVVGEFIKIGGALMHRGADGTVGGQEAVGSFELSAPAPCVTGCGTYVNGERAGGMLVQVTSSNPTLAKVQPSGSILVPTGQTRGNFTVLTSAVSNKVEVTISAAREGSPAQSARLQIVPPTVKGFTVDQSSVVGGNSIHGTVTFTGPPASAGALSAKLSSNSNLVQLPSSVAPDVNATAVTFEIKTAGVPANTPITISAEQGGKTVQTSATLKPAAMTSFARVYPCLCGPLTATLDGAAPAGGLKVAISNSNPTAATVPATITIPAGANTGTVDVAHHETYSVQHATIGATVGSVSKKWDEYIAKMVKPDLYIRTVTLQDRFGNTITQPADSQPFKACITVASKNDMGGDYQYPAATKMRVGYLSPVAGGASAGHEFDVNVPSFHPSESKVYVSTDETYLYLTPICVDLPGVQAHSYLDLTLTEDVTNVVSETNEGNNTHKQRITRP